MTKALFIRTLAEFDILVAILKNETGETNVSTYHAPILEDDPADRDDILRQLLTQAQEKGVHLKIKNIFTPLKESKFEQYNRHYHDDAIRILRILAGEFPDMFSFLRREDIEEDIEILQRNSPPLYDKLKKLGLI